MSARSQGSTAPHQPSAGARTRQGRASDAPPTPADLHAPTEEGHEWRCCGCPYRTGSINEAADHLRSTAVGPWCSMYEMAEGERYNNRGNRRMYRQEGTGEVLVGRIKR